MHIMDLPDALKRKKRKGNFSHRNQKHYGTSIEQRPGVVNERTEVGHWEVDTVVGKRAGREAVVLSLLEKKTQHYIARLIPGKTSQAVMSGMKQLREEYGDAFSQVFKTLTADNGSEFADLSQVEGWGSRVYFAHPYAAWERGQNERHNGLFRAYVPKGQSMACYSEEDILSFADQLNGRPRRKLGYRTPEELFDAFLDQVYTASRL